MGITSGKWEVFDAYDGLEFKCYGIYSREDPHTEICRVNHIFRGLGPANQDNSEEVLANAKALGAVPELIEALLLVTRANDYDEIEHAKDVAVNALRKAGAER